MGRRILKMQSHHGFARRAATLVHLGGGGTQEETSRVLLAALDDSGTTIVRRYGPGDTLLGSRDDALHIVVSGVVKLRYSFVSKQDRPLLMLLGPFQTFGYTTFGDILFRDEFVETATACEVVKAPAILVEQACRTHKEVAPALATLMELRLVEYQKLVSCLLSRKVEDRLTNLLPILADKFGTDDPHGRRLIDLRLKQEDLADMISATRESVNTALRRLQSRRIIEIEGGHLFLLDT